VSGIAASSLAVMVPVRAGSSAALLAALDRLGDGDQGPFARVPGTHFGRFAFIPVLTGARGEALESEGSFLLMCAEFDSPVAAWTTLLCDRAGDQLESVMGYCEGFPGCGDPTAVAEYFSAHDTPPGFTVAGYRRIRVEEVREALRLQRALGELAMRAQSEGLEGASLRAAWREAVRR
jgi:hypothetical protein